ncbi:unnamed protein product [Closterium sp. NIES-53]
MPCQTSLDSRLVQLARSTSLPQTFRPPGPALLLSCPPALLLSCPPALLLSCPPALLFSCSAALLPSCSAALLLCCSAALLPSCSAALLLCCSAALLLSCPPPLLLCCSAALLPSCSAALLPSCSAALLLCCSPALLLCCSAALLPSCSAALLLCCSAALLLSCPSALLLCCSAALLLSCSGALVYPSSRSWKPLFLLLAHPPCFPPSCVFSFFLPSPLFPPTNPPPHIPWWQAQSNQRYCSLALLPLASCSLTLLPLSSRSLTLLPLSSCSLALLPLASCSLALLPSPLSFTCSPVVMPFPPAESHCYYYSKTPSFLSHTLGGSGLSPWGYGVKKWKPKGVIHAGDTLVFKWRGIPHDVWIMNTMDAYNACDFGAATRKTGITSVGKYKYKVPASAKGKSIFFSCSVPGHCSAFNMKVAVPIHA